MVGRVSRAETEVPDLPSSLRSAACAILGQAVVQGASSDNGHNLWFIGLEVPQHAQICWHEHVGGAVQGTRERRRGLRAECVTGICKRECRRRRAYDAVPSERQGAVATTTSSTSISSDSDALLNFLLSAFRSSDRQRQVPTSPGLRQAAHTVPYVQRRRRHGCRRAWS